MFENQTANININGTIERILFAQTNFVIAKLTNNIVIKGNMLSPQIGLQYDLVGRWEIHPKFGKQFAFTDYETHYPTGKDAIESYLIENAKWIGKTTAKALVETYGDHTLEICKSDPDKVAADIKGITKRKSYEIAAMLRMNEDNETLRLELKTMLGGTKVTKRSINKIIEKYGKDAPAFIKKNPYALIDEIDGIGFLTADQVAQKIGYAFDGEPRIQAGIVHRLREAAHGDGHTRVGQRALILLSADLLTLDSIKVEAQLQPMIDDDIVTLSSDNESVALKYLNNCERSIAKKLKILSDYKLPHGQAIVEGLAEDQIEAIEQAVKSSVFILTGSPGTGKTFTIKRIISSFPTAKIAIAAPTGKAAKRAMEQTGHQASTIHKLLEPQVSNGKFYFTRGEEHPLEENMVILDEASMIDVSLFNNLLMAISPGTRLIIIGDVNQLPSVGPGLVLKDIIDSGVIPCVELKTIKRQNPGMLLRNIHAIKAGHPIEMDNKASDDFFFIKKDDPQEIQQIILNLVEKRLPDTYKVDKVRDIQVMSPVNEKTDLSCKALNELLRNHLNPNRPPEKCPFAIEDKIIQTKNDYSLGIINGDVGYVKEIDFKGKEIVVAFTNPDRVVAIPMYENDLRLAYALTVHKCQGSEMPIVVIPIHKSFGSLIMTRNWLYTAISRATKVCVLVGQEGEVAKTIKRMNPVKRNTSLKEMLMSVEFPE